jgi:hypothetical protein
MTQGFARVEKMFDDQDEEVKKILKVCKILPKDNCGNDNDAEFGECFDDTVARSDVNKIDKESLVTTQFPGVDVVTEAETPLVDTGQV